MIALGLCGLLGLATSARSHAQALSGSATSADHQSVVDGESCSCTRTYIDGHTEQSSTCDEASTECLSIDTLVACQDDPLAPACSDGLDRCECYCHGDSQLRFDHEPEDGVYLTGIPNFWQHDSVCQPYGYYAPIGCGPLAMTMLLYWYDQQGWPGLAPGSLEISGLRVHDWQQAAEYAAEWMPRICSPTGSGTAVLPHELAPALDDYLSIHVGHPSWVAHWKVCGGCNTTQSDQLLPAEGIDIVKGQLEAGRPVIVGFNLSPAIESQATVDGETIYTGELSNGSLVTGTISHYGVITGYRRASDGRDVLYMNAGLIVSDGSTSEDMAFEWNVGGKWLHLYTVNPGGGPLSGIDWCPMDDLLATGNLARQFAPLAQSQPRASVSLSHASRVGPGASERLTVLAGSSCGIARAGAYELYTPGWTESLSCAVPGDLPPPFDPTASQYSSRDDATEADPRQTFDTEPGDPISPGPR